MKGSNRYTELLRFCAGRAVVRGVDLGAAFPMNDSRSRLFPRKGLARQALQEHSDPSATAVISSSLPCLLRRRTQCHDTPGSYASVAKPPHQTPPRCLTCSRDRPIPAPAHLQDHSQFEKRRENFAKEIDIAIVDVGERKRSAETDTRVRLKCRLEEKMLSHSQAKGWPPGEMAGSLHYIVFNTVGYIIYGLCRLAIKPDYIHLSDVSE
ncbi:unnamed protein product [Miscanthus lutarioriparius]|uniref:Uncharacterized protein n=1 Tax=Miscanthus lutarioriparius TaxID=422564 RepID=A0A811R6D5_9POAL|nr:unnamed protein product [Miscanthus lutarioriparius]